MFKYMGKTFVTVEDARKAEMKEKGKTVSYKAMEKTLEELRKECFLAKRKHGKQVGYTIVRGDKEAVLYDDTRTEALELIEAMGRDLDLGFHEEMW